MKFTFSLICSISFHITLFVFMLSSSLKSRKILQSHAIAVNPGVRVNNPESNDPIDLYFIKVVLWFNPLRNHASYVKPNFLFNLFYFIQNLHFYHQAI